MADIRINALANTASSTASDDYLAVDGTTNGTRKLSAYSPTFGGNLTVSGTSSFAGNVNISLAAANESARFTITNTEPGGWGNTLNLVGTGSDAVARTMASFYSSATGSWANAANSNSILYLRTLNAGTLTTGVTLSGAGNVSVAGNLTVSGTGTSSVAGTWLIATTTDSGNGKLQLATHTTSAGGIGFGTDISLYRKSAAVFGFNGVADVFLETAGAGLWLGSAAGTYQVGINRSSNNLVFWTGSFTTALTLDSTQNATFAGSIAIGNTVQTAVSVASTHKVTISIGGSTYYLLATNV